MRLDNDKKSKDKVEITKQQQAEIQKGFDSRIRPHENHTLFEFDLETKEIRLAVFDSGLEIHWNDAVKGNYGKNKVLTKKHNCMYISCLNKQNVIKILKRDFGIACL